MSRRSGANGAPVPVAVKPRGQQFASGGLGFGGTGRFNGFGGYQLHVSEYFGSGHTGVTPTDRIVMAFKCGIDSEIEQSLSTLAFFSCHSPELVKFEQNEYLGKELIKFFLKPYLLILEGEENKVTSKIINLSQDSLIVLRNATQDLDNQQWLSQVKNFKKHIVEVLKLLVSWIYSSEIKSYHLSTFQDLWNEALPYLLDLIDPLSCYYVDNNKQDPLFNQLLLISTQSKDKYILTTTIKCLGHLLFVSDKTKNDENNGKNGSITENINEIKQSPHNCIDAITEDHLQRIVGLLFINDDEITHVVLSFLKQYLTSESLHPNYPDSVKESQLHRLKKLVQINSSRLNLQILMKQLPQLILSKIPLIDQSKIPETPSISLSKRSTYSGIRSTRPTLPADLYKVVVRLPEPLRATTWLRCCYEPYYPPSEAASNINETSEVAPGEVTQISLWKAYETQFEEIWKNDSKLDHASLLAAVEFIKNVTSAFPESETMVVNIPSADPSKPAKKKFVIKGIQPRQFPVSIEIGNYEALRKRQNQAMILGNESSGDSSLPVGHVDYDKFQHIISLVNDKILEPNPDLPKIENHFLNSLSHDILDYIITELLDPDTDGEYKNIFRYYNIDWLPELIYANPGLIQNGYINTKWLLYLV